MATAAELDAWKELLKGQTLKGYELLECIGTGNFGLVFESIKQTTGSRFAVKVLIPGSNAGAVLDFENEALLLRKLNPCDGVITFVDGGEESISVTANGVTVPLPVRFHVLTIASGSVNELTEDPATRSSLDWIERLQMWRGAVKSAHQMHIAGVAHRDLKSDNCLMMVTGDVTRIRLGDLGRGKDLSLPATGPADQYIAGRGDIRFAPPEFLWVQGGDRAADFLAADYYGLGSLLVELATGHPVSALVFGDVRTVLQQAAQEHARGRHGDLSTLTLRYHRVIEEVVDLMPKSVRDDARVLLRSMCSPLPRNRLARALYRRDRLQKYPLDWVLKRIDIMIRRLAIDAREQRRSTERLERAAS